MPSYGCVTNCGIKLAGIHFDNFSAIKSIYYFAGSLQVLSRGIEEVGKLAAREKHLAAVVEEEFTIDHGHPPFFRKASHTCT